MAAGFILSYCRQGAYLSASSGRAHANIDDIGPRIAANRSG
jgi:hypothetical protein